MQEAHYSMWLPIFPTYMQMVSADGKVGDANDNGVVSLDGSAWLRPTHFNEGLLEGDHFFDCV